MAGQSSLLLGIVVAAIAWIILYVVLSIPLWVAFVVAAAIILASLAAVGGGRTSMRGRQ
jgi:hypothetical protein